MCQIAPLCSYLILNLILFRHNWTVSIKKLMKEIKMHKTSLKQISEKSKNWIFCLLKKKDKLKSLKKEKNVTNFLNNLKIGHSHSFFFRPTTDSFYVLAYTDGHRSMFFYRLDRQVLLYAFRCTADGIQTKDPPDLFCLKGVTSLALNYVGTWPYAMDFYHIIYRRFSIHYRVVIGLVIPSK